MPSAGYVALTAMPAAPLVGSTRTWAPSRDEDAIVTLRVAGGAALRGRLLDAAGRGIEAAVSIERRVPGERDPWRWTGITSAGADGRFTLDAAPLGPLSIDVKAPGRLAVTGRIVEHRSGEEMLLRIGGAPGATVAGIVTDGAGAPVPDAAVLVYTHIAGNPNERQNFPARTAADGSYRVDGLAACLRTTLLVDAEGYAPVSLERNVPLAAGATDRWDVRLFRGATIEGRVVGENGSPIEGATFTLGPPGTFPPPQARVTRSRPDGRFLVEGVALGEVVWRVRADGWYDPIVEAMQFDPYRSEAAGRKLRLATEGERKLLDVSMKRGIPVTGSVVDAEGRSVAGARVSVTYDRRGGEIDGAAGPFADTDARGRFAFAGLTPGRGARLHATARNARTAGDVTIPDGLESREVVLRMVATGRITGRVVDERGEGIARVQVSRDDLAPGSFTDGSGAFRLRDVPEGPHEVHLLDGQSRPRGQRIPVTILPGVDGRDVEIRVLDPARLGGVVVDEAGVPVAQAMLSAIAVGLTVEPWFTITDANGEFQLVGVSPGSYRIHLDGVAEPVTASSGALDLRLVRKPEQSERLSGTVVDAEGRPVARVRLAIGWTAGTQRTIHVHDVGGGRFDIAVPTTDPTVTVEAYDASDEAGRRLPLRPWRREAIDIRTPLAIRMEPGRRLEGHVLDANGVGAEGVQLRIRSQGGVIAGSGDSAVPVPTTRADAQGHFVFEGLLDGALVFEVQSRDGHPATPNVTVQAGHNAIEIRLPEMAAVSGLVLDDRGRPLAGVVVHGDTEHRYPGRWSTTTDAEGGFRLEGFPASAERFRVWLPTPAGRGTAWPWLADHAVEAKPGAKDLVVKLERGVFVEGTLVDEQGRPTAGRVVALGEIPEGMPTELFPGPVLAGAWPVESSNGRFAAGPVRPGVLRLMGEGAPGSQTKSDVIPIAAPSTNARIVLRPVPPAVPR